MDETTASARGDAPDPRVPGRKGLPAWAWTAIGIVVGAAVIGGAWLAFGSQTGKVPQATESSETTVTQSVDLTESIEPTAADEPTAAADVTAAPQAAASSASSGGSSSGGSSSSGSSGSSSSGDSQTNPLPVKPLLQKPNIPIVLWKTYVNRSGSGSWTSPAFFIENPAVARITILITATDGGSASLSFNKTTMANKLYWKRSPTEVGQAYASPDIQIVGGWQRVKIVCGSAGVQWKVTVKARKD